jgi:hypothetical protein
MNLKKWEISFEELFPALMGFICGIAMVILSLVGFMRGVQAATYNVLFNNVEQGAGSTANPTVHVADGKAVKSEGTSVNPLATMEPAPSPAASPAAAPEKTVAAGNGTAPAPEGNKLRRARFALGGAVLGQNRGDLESGSKWGGSLNASYFFLDELGVNAFTGWTPGRSALVGTELEFVPLHATFFGQPRFIELGALAGASTLGRSQGLWGTVHAGARATVNFSDRYGLTATVRTNLTDRSRYDYLLAEVGLTVRL